MKLSEFKLKYTLKHLKHMFHQYPISSTAVLLISFVPSSTPIDPALELQLIPTKCNEYFIHVFSRENDL